jgi:hypothetical protein
MSSTQRGRDEEAVGGPRPVHEQGEQRGGRLHMVTAGRTHVYPDLPISLHSKIPHYFLPSAAILGASGKEREEVRGRETT